MRATAVVLIAVLCFGCSDAYEPFAAIKVGMSKAEVITLVGEPDDVKDVAGLPPEDTCRQAEGDELLLYRLEDSTLRFWQRSAERTVRVCVDSQEKVVRKDVQIITRWFTGNGSVRLPGVVDSSDLSVISGREIEHAEDRIA